MAAAQTRPSRESEGYPPEGRRGQPDRAPKLAVLARGAAFNLKRRRLDFFAQFFDGFAGAREREPMGVR